jgi:hypothetical protein
MTLLLLVTVAVSVTVAPGVAGLGDTVRVVVLDAKALMLSETVADVLAAWVASPEYAAESWCVVRAANVLTANDAVPLLTVPVPSAVVPS